MARVPKSMSFRICVYPSPDGSGSFTAHCMELDVMGEGKSVESALSEMLEVIETQIETCRESHSQFLFPAPDNIWQEYRKAKNAGRVISGELIDRVIHNANRRLGHNIPSLDNVVGSSKIPREFLAMV